MKVRSRAAATSILAGLFRFSYRSFVCCAVLVLWLAISASAIVICHDYTLYRVTCSNGRCEDSNNLPAVGRGGLRERLAALGYKGTSITNTALNDVELAHSVLKPGDVLFIRDAHSGYVNENYTIDHFLQIYGETGRERSPNSLPRHIEGSDQPGGLFLGDSLAKFLSRPMLQSALGSLEVWRRASNPARPKGRAAFDLDGSWDATITDQFGTEKLLWQLTSGRSSSTIDWSLRTTLLSTTKQARQQFANQTWTDGYLEYREDQGKWYYSRARGSYAFNQSAECVVASGSITCDGKQSEFQREWPIRIQATRKGSNQGGVPAVTTPQPQAAAPVTPPRRMARYTADQVNAMRQWISYYEDLRVRWTQYRDQSVAPYLNNGVYYQWARAEYQRSNQQIQLAQQWIAYYQNALRQAGIQ